MLVIRVILFIGRHEKDYGEKISTPHVSFLKLGKQ